MPCPSVAQAPHLWPCRRFAIPQFRPKGTYFSMKRPHLPPPGGFVSENEPTEILRQFPTQATSAAAVAQKNLSKNGGFVSQKHMFWNSIPLAMLPAARVVGTA